MSNKGEFTDEEIRDALAGPDVWVSWDNRVNLPDTEHGCVFLEGQFTARQLRMLVYLMEREG